jgi:hypothetical protein
LIVNITKNNNYYIRGVLVRIRAMGNCSGNQNDVDYKYDSDIHATNLFRRQDTAHTIPNKLVNKSVSPERQDELEGLNSLCGKYCPLMSDIVKT